MCIENTHRHKFICTSEITPFHSNIHDKTKIALNEIRLQNNSKSNQIGDRLKVSAVFG